MKASKLSEQEKDIISTQPYQRYASWRNRFVVKLAVSHISLVFIFDIVAIYFPELMMIPLGPATLFTTGTLSALLIVFLVIFFTFYYSHRVNKEYSSLKDSLKGLI